MSGSVREWLPREAIDSAPVRSAVAATVDTWSHKWFGTGGLAATGFEPLRLRAPVDVSGWRIYGSAVALEAGARATILLAGLALGAEPERLVLSEVDRDIIGRFTTRVAEDLALSLERAIGLDPPEGADGKAVEESLRDGGLLFSVADLAGEHVLRGAIPTAALAPFRKSVLPPARPRRSTSRLARAIGATSVRVEARLGQTTLPLGAFAGLVPGDVLILDRPVAAGVGLALSRSDRTFASGTIAEEREGLALVLTPHDREI